MSNAKIIYDQIVDLNYINNRMIGQPLEDTWLDCKQKHSAIHGKLEKDDRSNFAKVLSGFANTSGGVLIFGVDARKIGGIDVIQDLKPIKELKLFESELREAESRVLERAVSGLEYKKIYTDEPNDTGVIKIYIPDGINPPYRSIIDKQFYIRAGGSFVPIDLPHIESLVLKNIKPDLEMDIYFTRENEFNTEVLNNILINFQITNIGKSVGKYVLLEVCLGRNMHELLAMGSLQLTGYAKRVDPATECYVYNWYYERVVHPNETIQPTPFQFLYEGNIDAAESFPLLFKFSIYAENMPRKTYSVAINGRHFFFAIRGDRKYQLIKGRDFTIE